jgi:WD40-like Beta Propeller Repeat
LVERAIGPEGGSREFGELPAPPVPGLVAQDLSSDGRTLLFMRAGASGLFSASLENVQSGISIRRLLDDEVRASDPRFSPDNRWIVYAAERALFVQRFPGPARRRQIAPVGTDPEWRGDGKEIVYFGTQGSVWSVTVEGGADAMSFGTPMQLFSGVRIPPAVLAARQLAVSRDGSRFYIAEAVEQPTPSVIHVTNSWIVAKKSPKS